MIKPPPPTFVAAYPSPKQSNFYVYIIAIAIILLAVYFYLDKKFTQDEKETVKSNLPEDQTKESIKDLPSGSIFSGVNGCPIGSTVVSSGIAGGFLCSKN